MYFQFEISVEIERSEGKFISREEAAELIQGELENMGLDSIEGSDGGQYEVTQFDVSEIEQTKPMSRRNLVEAITPAVLVLAGSQDQKEAQRKAEQFLMLLEASGRHVV